MMAHTETLIDPTAAPPHSLEAEQGVIGSMLLNPRQGIAEAANLVTSRYFFVPAHQKIYSLLLELWEKGKPINLISFTQDLRDRNMLESIGGAAYVSQLVGFVPTDANIGHYLAIVRDKYILREIILSAAEAVRKAYHEQYDPRGLLEQYQSSAIDIGRIAKDDETAGTLEDFIDPALRDIRASYHARGKCTGISTGFPDLDRTMNGFEAPLTYYFAARPAMGKSSMMLALAEHIAIRVVEQKKRIKIFSLEMTGKMLAKRLICSRANIELKALRHGFMDQEAIDEHAARRKNFIPRADAAAAELMTDYVMIDEKGDLNILEFRARARQAVIKDGCQLIMVDYLQRMKGASKRAAAHRELEINEIAQGISTTAKELNVPIVVLAQLNRKPEDRWNGRPELGDVRESGSVEQEARFVGLLWRPWYYASEGKKKDRMVGDLEREFKDYDFSDAELYRQFAICDVAKQNEGPVGPIVLRFLSEYARFEPEDPDRPLFSNDPEKRQAKAHAKPAPVAAGNGEPDEDEINQMLSNVRKHFPNANETND
jgi:replicative DNA helicase